jgi:hypothetical protein
VASWVADLFASGAGLLNPFDPVPAVKDAVGSRELVRLERSGDLLVGSPSHRVITRIILHAASPPDTASLVLWSREEAGGAMMVRLTAPGDLTPRVAFATVFLDPARALSGLAVAREGAWVDLPEALGGRPVPLSPAGGGPAVLPFSLPGLGTILLTGQGVGAKPRPPSVDPGHVDAGTRWVRAGWHVLVPGLALAVMRRLSRRQHETAIEESR